jgi:nucleotide-binding universal stress UspA family protein
LTQIKAALRVAADNVFVNCEASIVTWGHIMSYKTIVVHLSGAPESAARVELAVAMAERYQAKLIGIAAADFARAIAFEVGYVDPVMIEQAEADATAARAAAEAQFNKAVAGRSLSAECRLIKTAPTNAVVSESFAGDLIIIGQSRSETAALTTQLDRDEVVFESAAPVLVVPTGSSSGAFNRVVIGWKPTRETARAVHEALPLLREAKEIIVLSVADDRRYADALYDVDITAALSRHGLRVERAVIGASDLGVGKSLRDEAERRGAELIVTGAYGHSRLREWILGGVTQDLLDLSSIPVLMAH